MVIPILIASCDFVAKKLGVGVEVEVATVVERGVVDGGSGLELVEFIERNRKVGFLIDAVADFDVSSGIISAVNRSVELEMVVGGGTVG